MITLPILEYRVVYNISEKPLRQKVSESYGLGESHVAELSPERP